MSSDEISIEDAAKAVPCDPDTLRKWLQQGKISGRDSFGRRDRNITAYSTGIKISVQSLVQFCNTIGVKPDFTKK